MIGRLGGSHRSGAVLFQIMLQVALSIFPGNAEPSAKRPNVILVTVDTLRADRLGCYGDRAAVTPNLDGLARDGIRFSQVAAQVPLTLPSHCSIMTGTFPPYHGVRDNIGYVLDEEQITIAELLKSNGYETAGFVGAFVLDRSTGIAQGLDTYSDDFGLDLKEPKLVNLGYVERPGDQVLAPAIAWINSRHEKPFFAWIHLFDPHDPYRPPEPFASRFQHDPYRGEIAYVDQQFGRLMELLRKLGIYDNSVIVMTSDHGEALGEHGEATHGLFVYESSVRVPLIIKLMDSQHAGSVIDQPVQSVDIFPTLIQVLGLNKLSTLQGTGLLGLVLGRELRDRPLYMESLYPRSQFGWSSLRAIREGDYKYIKAPRPELYNLSEDPGELVNLASTETATANRMDRVLGRFIGRYTVGKGAGSSREVDAEALEKLRSLGYVGLSAGTSVEGIDDAKLADPKDKTEVYRMVLQEMHTANQSSGETRIRRLEGILEEEPQLAMVLSSLGEAYQRAGRYDDAIDVLQSGLAIRPWDETILYLMAYCFLQKNDIEAAISGFGQVLKAHPDHYGASFNLGVALTRRGELDAAAAQFQRLLILRPEDPQGHEGLGYIFLKQGKIDEADKEFRRALGNNPDLATAHLWLGFCRLEEAKRYQRSDPQHQAIPQLLSEARRRFLEAIRLDDSLRAKIPPSMQQ